MSKHQSSVRSNGVKVIVTHDWIRLDLGNNRGLTSSFGGDKATGAVPMHVFNAWCKVRDASEDTFMQRIEEFADRIGDLWPEWNVAPDTSSLAVGTKHPLRLGARKPTVTVEVVNLPKRKGGNYTVRMPDNTLCAIPADLLLSGGV